MTSKNTPWHPDEAARPPADLALALQNELERNDALIEKYQKDPNQKVLTECIRRAMLVAQHALLSGDRLNMLRQYRWLQENS